MRPQASLLVTLAVIVVVLAALPLSKGERFLFLQLFFPEESLGKVYARTLAIFAAWWPRHACRDGGGRRRGGSRRRGRRRNELVAMLRQVWFLLRV